MGGISEAGVGEGALGDGLYGGIGWGGKGWVYLGCISKRQLGYSMALACFHKVISFCPQVFLREAFFEKSWEAARNERHACFACSLILMCSES